MNTKILLTSAVVFALNFGNAEAQIKQHAQNQKHRVKQGVESGELTKAEAKDLAINQREIYQDVRLAKADGRITAGERKIITSQQSHQSRKIYRKKHNKRERS